MMLERENQVATIFCQLMVTNQSDGLLEVLSASCILTVTVAVDSEAFHMAKSSAQTALEMCRERLVEMSFTKTAKRVGEITPP